MSTLNEEYTISKWRNFGNLKKPVKPSVSPTIQSLASNILIEQYKEIPRKDL